MTKMTIRSLLQMGASHAAQCVDGFVNQMTSSLMEAEQWSGTLPPEASCKWEVSDEVPGWHVSCELLFDGEIVCNECIVWQ